jgi:hypothetical protein
MKQEEIIICRIASSPTALYFAHVRSLLGKARQGKARQGKAGQGRQGRLKIHEKAIGVYADAVAAVNSFHT